jgi:hypothetical protein
LDMLRNGTTATTVTQGDFVYAIGVKNPHGGVAGAGAFAKVASVVKLDLETKRLQRIFSKHSAIPSLLSCKL